MRSRFLLSLLAAAAVVTRAESAPRECVRLREQLTSLGVPDDDLSALADLERSLDAGLVDQQALLRLSESAPSALQPVAEAACWRRVRERLLEQACSGTDEDLLEPAGDGLGIDVPAGGFVRLGLSATPGSTLDMHVSPPRVRLRVFDTARCRWLADAAGSVSVRVPEDASDLVAWIDDPDGASPGAVHLSIHETPATR
jgi:hypothetical protein